MAIVVAIPLVASILFLVACLVLWLRRRHRHDFDDQELGPVAVPLESGYTYSSVTALPAAKKTAHGSLEIPCQVIPAFTNGSILPVAGTTQGPELRIQHTPRCDKERDSAIFNEYNTQPAVHENTPILQRELWEYPPPVWLKTKLQHSAMTSET